MECLLYVTNLSMVNCIKTFQHYNNSNTLSKHLTEAFEAKILTNFELCFPLNESTNQWWNSVIWSKNNSQLELKVAHSRSTRLWYRRSNQWNCLGMSVGIALREFFELSFNLHSERNFGSHLHFQANCQKRLFSFTLILIRNFWNVGRIWFKFFTIVLSQKFHWIFWSTFHSNQLCIYAEIECMKLLAC